MKKLTIIFLSFLLAGCHKDYYVALYKDTINKDAIVAIFPLQDLEGAIKNCQSTIILYREDDAKNGYTSIITGMAPEYYCQQIRSLHDIE